MKRGAVPSAILDGRKRLSALPRPRLSSRVHPVTSRLLLLSSSPHPPTLLTLYLTLTLLFLFLLESGKIKLGGEKRGGSTDAYTWVLGLVSRKRGNLRICVGQLSWR
jgi:hypothetical protein